jgi:hypothetical protein
MQERIGNCRTHFADESSEDVSLDNVIDDRHVLNEEKRQNDFYAPKKNNGIDS